MVNKIEHDSYIEPVSISAAMHVDGHIDLALSLKQAELDIAEERKEIFAERT